MTLTSDEFTGLLDRLLAGWENEVVEFKEAAHQFSADKTGEYVPALSNEANLRGLVLGWLVFGISNARQVVGTSYLLEVQQRQALKHHIHQSIDQGLTVREVYEVTHSGKRVVLLEVPVASRGILISWKGDYRTRTGESLVPLSLDKLDEIRRQTISAGWLAIVVPEATLAHLDPAAIIRVRQGSTERYASRIPAGDIETWDGATSLAKAQLTRDGQITRTALLLLGAGTSTHLLTPHPAQMTWKLVGEQRAYEHFRLPLLLGATALVKRTRNVQPRFLPPDELIYREISKHDERSLLEAFYSCIAHQDYMWDSRIVVTEYVDRIVLESMGEFLDGVPDDYMPDERTPRQYRSPSLVEVIAELNLIDQVGYGIHRMVQDQAHRFLSLPDYDLSITGEVKLTTSGAVIDESHSQLLMVHIDLSLEDVLVLDRVQKGLEIGKKAARHLRRIGSIEGRKSHRWITSHVVTATGTMADCIRTRSQAGVHYAAPLTDFLQIQGYTNRGNVEVLFRPALSEALIEQQKVTKITNLLTKLRRRGVTVNRGVRTKPRWELSYVGDESVQSEPPRKKDDDVSGTARGLGSA